MKLRLLALTSFVLVGCVTSTSLAQEQTPEPMVGMDHSMHMAAPISACDIDSFILQQQTWAAALAGLADAYAQDPDTALRAVYNAGQTYQQFALDCGFVPPAEDAHDSADHDHAEATTQPDDHSEHSESEHAAIIAALGDPANGETLFNTLQPQTGFACATCHRVDSTEMLIGPGLINVGSTGHDPAAHGSEGQHSAEATPAPERTIEEVITYIQTSILHPSDYVVPGYPDLLMPQIYEQVFTEQQVNDIVAYLLSIADE